MVTYVGSTIRVVEPSEQLIQWCKEHLTLPNPDYYKKERMGLWTGKTPETISLWRMGSTTPSHLPMLEMPFGVFLEVRHLLENVDIVFGVRERVNYGNPIPLYDYQKQAVDAVVRNRYGILQAPAGCGKGLPLCAKIYTPDGFTRNGDLKIGDKVLDAYGGICWVTGIYDRGKQNCFKITFTDDTSVICDKDHLWQVRNVRNGTGWQVLNTETLYKKGVTTSNGNRLWEIPITQPVAFKERKVTIDPWLLGVLLGDGTFCDREVSISNTEQDIIERVRQVTNSPVYFRKDRVSMIITDKGSLHYRLLDYGLQGLHSWEKFIPKDYIYNSVDVRLNVLRGLVDTDGSVDRSSVTITSTSRRLIEDCLEIVQSLGGTGKISTRNTFYTYNGEKKPGRESYRLSLKLYQFEPYSSEKHKRNGSIRTRYLNAYRRIKSIEVSPPRETRCITVDSVDSLYLTDGFVVTHNTQMGLAVIQKHGYKALWLTHTKDLLNQSKERAERYMDKSLMGTITEGKVDIGKGITFATVQTMAKQDLREYRNEWGVIVVDEVHRVCASANGMAMFQKVLNSLAAGLKVGLSATVHRSDGLIRATFALIGRVVYTVPEDAVKALVEPVSVETVQTDAVMPDEAVKDDGSIMWAKLINGLCADDGRCAYIADKIIENRDYSCLILSDRLFHLETLMGMLPDDMRADAVMISGKMTSKKGKAERELAIEQMRTGEKKYLFSSYNLSREGLDIPRLERLFLTTPQKDEAVIIQSLGRIARKFEGKAKPVCIDFVDGKIGIMVGMYKKRLRIYREKGVSV